MFTAMLVCVFFYFFPSFFWAILGFFPFNGHRPCSVSLPTYTELTAFLSNQPSCFTQEYLLYNSICLSLNYIPPFRCS
jgi:hypothetical protein